MHYYYLETPSHYDTSSLRQLAEKFHLEVNNEIDLKCLFIRNNDETYAVLRHNPKQLELVSGNDKLRFSYYLERGQSETANYDAYDICNLTDSKFIAAWSPDIANNSLYCLHKRGEEKYAFSNIVSRVVFKDLDRNYYSQFEKYGDSSKESYYFYWSKPYMDTPFHTIYYVNDFGDLILKDERDDFILSVTRRVY